MDIFTLSVINLLTGSCLLILFSIKLNFTTGLSYKKDISLVGFCLFLHSLIVVLNEVYTLPYLIFPSLVNALIIYTEVYFLIFYRKLFGCPVGWWLHLVPVLLFLALNFDLFANDKNNRILLSVFTSLVVYLGFVKKIENSQIGNYRSLLYFARFVVAFSTIQMVSLALYVFFNTFINDKLGVKSLYLELGVFGFTVYSFLIFVFCVLYLFQFRYDKLKGVAEHDSLTDLFNRHTLNRKIGQELNKAERYGYSVCVAMVDIDFFKKINDDYGHLTGDKVLAESAYLIKKLFRGYDLIFRYGGEEFLIFLPNIQIDEASRKVEQLRYSCEYFSFSEQIQITFSIGYVVTNQVSSVEDLIKKADDALYIAKHTGRNNCVLWNSKSNNIFH